MSNKGYEIKFDKTQKYNLYFCIIPLNPLYYKGFIGEFCYLHAISGLGLVYARKGQHDKAIDYGSQALQMISTFQDHPYQEAIQKLFAERYCLNPPKLKNKILDFCKQGLDFTDYKLHFYPTLSQDNSNASEQQVEEMIEKYKLALLFLPKEESAIKLEIYNKLTELTGVNQKSIELWLAVVEGDTDKIKELITAEVSLDNVLFITTTPLIQAVIKGDVAMVRLISEKADINKADNDKNQASPLYYSLGYEGQAVNMKIVELLLENGADVNKPMYDGALSKKLCKIPSLSERLCKYDIRISPSLIDIFPFLVISNTKYGKLI